MNTVKAALALAVCVLLACGGAGAQSTLGQPASPTPPAKPAPPTQVKPAPVKPAPARPATQPRPAAHPAPLVQPQRSPHAQRPPGKTTPAPAPVPAPVPAPEPAPPPAPTEPAKGSVSGLPLPRFAALRTDDVNLRRGPGTRYPIDWVYRRRDLPVEIEREFEVWRLVSDPDGVKGWVHQATLTGRRSFIVTGQQRVLRRTAGADAAAVARLQPGVVGRIRACEAASDWCEVQVGEYRGFIRRDEVWGTYPGEAVN